MTYKLTSWFNEEIKPVHIGVYQTIFNCDNLSIEQGYSFWDGCEWKNSCSTIDRAMLDELEGIQEKMWRGLENKP